MRVSVGLLAAAVAVALVAPVRGDIAPPVPPPKTVNIKVEIDANAKAPVLIVPSTAVFPGRPRGPRPFGPDTEVAEENAAAPGTSRTLVAGVALAAALALGGLWLARKGGRPSTRGLALFAAAGATLAVGALVWANPAPPPKRPQPQPAVNLPVALDGKVTVQVVPGGDTVRLVLDKASYEKLKEKPKAPAKGGRALPGSAPPPSED